MTAPRGIKALRPIALVCLLSLAALSCNYDAVPGRFTYIVKYEVTTNVAAPGLVTVDVSYTEGTPTLPSTGTGSPALDTDTPWSYEVPAAFNYDDGYFYPTLTVDETGGTLTDGQTVTAKIIWKDYRSDFQEHVLKFEIIDGSPAVESLTLTGIELPVP
jgi:hypothetical protein